MAKLKPTTKTRITKLFKQDKGLPEIRETLKNEGFPVTTVQVKAVLRRYFIKYCDTLWSEAVKLKAGNLCVIENKPDSLNSHHLIGRTNYKYRWDVDNGVCLSCCRHTLAHDMAAHGSTSATTAFAFWMAENQQELWILFLTNRNDHETIKVDVYYLLETANRLEAEIETLKSMPKVDIMMRKKVGIIPKERTGK